MKTKYLTGITLAILFICGCTSTVTPITVRDKGASYDGNVRNSGLYGFTSEGSGCISAHARDRYNGLVETYGVTFKPPVQPNDGISPAVPGTPLFNQAVPVDPAPTNSYLIDAEHLAKFGIMNHLKKQPK